MGGSGGIDQGCAGGSGPGAQAVLEVAGQVLEIRESWLSKAKLLQTLQGLHWATHSELACRKRIMRICVGTCRVRGGRGRTGNGAGTYLKESKSPTVKQESARRGPASSSSSHIIIVFATMGS